MKERQDPVSTLDAALDASLRRSFRPPAGLEGRLVLPRAARARAGRRWSLLALGLVAAAALLALLLRPGERGLSAPGPTSERLAALPESSFPAIGPLLDPDSAPTARRPDLGRLYHAMAAAHQAEAVSACGEGDRLGERLERSYGPGVRLDPSATGRLHGPFASPEWPTGTILTGTIDEQTSVLIAERDETLSCCTDIRLPEGSGLQVFTWRMGDMALTEITPLGEPRLIEEFFP